MQKLILKQASRLISFAFLFTLMPLFAQTEPTPQNTAPANVSVNTSGPQLPEANKLQPVQDLEQTKSIDNKNPKINGEVQHIKEIKIKEKEEGANIYLNFDNVSLASVVNYLAEQKKINLMPHKDQVSALENTKVSLSTRNPLTLDRAWNVLLTLLEMNGFSMVKVGNIYRIIAIKDNNQEPLPIFSSATGTPPENLPDSDLVIRYLYFFKNIKTDMARGILEKILDPKNLIELKDMQAIMFKDLAMNIKAAMKIVKELDMGGLRESIRILPLHHANADNVSAIFKEILGENKDDKGFKFIGPMQTQESSYFSPTTKVLAEPVKNSLILLGPQKDLDKITNFTYKYLDVAIESAQTRIHLKEIRYAKAEDLKGIIENIIKPPKGIGEKTLMMGTYKIFEDVIIAAETGQKGDKATRGSGNRLIVSANKEDWLRIDKIINKLDKPQPQVALEIMVINISNTQSKELGASSRGIRGKNIPGTENLYFNHLSAMGKKTTTDNPAAVLDPTANLIDLAHPLYTGADNPSFISLGRVGTGGTGQNGVWSLIRAQFSSQNIQVVTQPFLVANNRERCNVNVTTTNLVSDALVSTKGEPQAQSKKDLKAENNITITPQINTNGTVDLTIEVKVSEFSDSTIPGQPDTLNRELTTRASMGAGEVLVLGGLTSSKLSEDIYKTPILGDIPIIGNLFRNKTKAKEEQNLYIFIRPSIIKPRFEGNPDEYTQLKLDYAKYQIMRNDTYVQNRHDPIQRWFFKPEHQTVSQKLSDAAKGVCRPIDDYTYGKSTPRSVNIREDKYYKVSEALDEIKKEKEAKKLLKIQQS